MATYNELFPDQPQQPFVPIETGRVRPELQQARGRARQAISFDGAPSDSPFDSAFGDLLTQAPAAPQPKGQTEWADYGKSAVAGVGDVGQAIAGAGEYAANRIAGERSTPFEQGFGDLADAFTAGRQGATQFAQSWFDSMTPEAKLRAEREVMTLDPNKTIWQGSPSQFLSSVGLKMARSAASTGATLLPGGLMMRAGLGRGALAYLGASEGGLSLGSIAANIAQEVEQAPEDELMQSQRYQQLRQQYDEPQARQQLIREAQGYAPIVGGLVVGAISAAAGRYLEPVFTDKAAGALGRFGRGFVSEAAQESGQSGAEQVAQNVAAQVFDGDRSTFAGVPEQMGQGALVGGVMGGGTVAALGPHAHARGISTGEATLTSSASPSPTQAAPESFQQVFKNQTPPAGGWRGGDIENGALPDIDAAGQRLLNVGPVDPAVQAALNARADNMIQDMFQQQGPTPQQEQAAYVQRPWPVTQSEMDLPQAQTGMVPSGPPVQQPLGLRERVRGGPPVTIEPTPAAPAQPDMSAPAGFSQERLPSGDLAAGRRPTRADMIRASQAQTRATGPAGNVAFRGYEGTVTDPSQQDLFGGQEQFGPDEPSAEPAADIQAQLEDLSDPDSGRTGVYLSRDNIAALRQSGTLDRLRSVGVPLANFDGKGGTLIAKDRPTAERLLAARDSGTPMQSILGAATGAGAGKPAGADIAVQQRDEQGNVVRESLVATPEEADTLATQFDAPGREGVVLSAGMAIKRRAQRIREESRQAQARGEVKQTRRRAEDIIESELGRTPLAERAVKKIGRNTLSENEAARRLVGYAARLRKTELKGAKGRRNIGEVLNPAVLEFDSPKAAEQYRELFSEYATASTASELAATAADRLKARARVEGLRRQIGAHRRLNKATTASEKIARVARKVSTEEVQKIEREARETAREKPRTEGDILGGDTRTMLERVTDEQLKGFADSEVNLLFAEAANIASGSRVSRGTVSGPQGETTAFTPHGRTLEEIIVAHPTRSEKVKLINRVKRMMKIREHGGKSKTTPITARAGVRKSPGGERTAIRRGTLRPQQALDLSPPRELSKAEQRKHDARARTAYSQLNKNVQAFQTRGANLDTQLTQAAQAREADGNPPHDARNAIYGRAYLRALTQYGEMLQQLRGRSKSSLREVERFNKITQDLLATPKDKFLAKLAQLTEAEADVQARAAIRVDPKTLANMSERRQRRALALESSANLREKIARAKRLHDVWHANAKYEQFVAPLMQKLIGYVTHDTSLANIASERRGLGYIPTFSEMRGLRYALQSFKQEDMEGLYKPLKRWFGEYGFKFDDNGDLVLAKNASQYEYVNEAAALRKLRDKAAFRNAPQNYNQKVAAQKARRAKAAADLETARRAALTPAQRAREDRNAAARAERARRAPMSYEQRSALEALDRQSRTLKLELMDINQDLPSLRRGAESIAAALEGGTTVPRLSNVLQTLASQLPSNHPYQPLVQRLISLNMDDAIIGWDNRGEGANAAFAHFTQITDPTGESNRVIRFNRKRLEELRAQGYDPSTSFVHALLHESVHAATAGAIANNQNVKLALWSIMRQARGAAKAQGISLLRGDREHYGFRDNSVDEFVAEAFTNQAFQDKLREIQIAPQRSVWQAIMDVVKRLLGLDDVPRINNALDAVLATTDKIFTGEMQNTTRGAEAALHLEDPTVKDKIANVVDKIMQSSRVTQSVRDKARDTIEQNKEGGSRLLLSALTMEQIRDFYANNFGGGRGPLSEYMKAFFQRNADNSANMEQADKLSRKWTALTEQHGQEAALDLSRIMAESTLYGIHADQPLTSAGNAHVQSAPQRQRHADLSKRYRALNPDFKQLYADVQKFYDTSLRNEVDLMTLNALRASVGEGDFPYTEQDIQRKKLNTVAGMEKEFGDRLTEQERKTIARMAALPDMRVGPYFPLMRFGDYVVTAEKLKEKKVFADRAEAQEWAAEQRANDPTLSVSSPQEWEEGYFVTVKEKEVRMAESPSEAEQNRQEMIAEYGAENVSKPMLKADLYSRGATIDSNSGLKTILGKLEGNPAAQAAIKDFYLRSLADGAFRKREIKRANRRGVNYDQQHRTFASYAKSAAYYTSQLRFGWRMADALIDMQKYVEETARGEHESGISPVRMGEVVREINTRDKLTTNHVEVSKLVRRGTELSQFMMLTSPSYWMINATQPYMVTLPWLAARSSVGEATAALTNAQKLIASPIVNQMGESFGGLKALWSKAGAEKAFTVLEQVEQHIKQRGGERAGEYIAMLNKLKRDSIIDLSFVAELRDIAEGQDTSPAQRVLDASRIMSHLSEVNNRIMSAIAAYDLYRNKGATPAVAEEFAKQAVSLTQFNYSSGNAPRLFQARGPLGQMGPLVFQFMKYPQHMYALLIDNFRRAVYSGGMDRQIALKTLAGLFATHLAAGGIVGAMLQPIKWAIGLTLAAFGDDDEPYTLKNALSGATFDRLIREATAQLFGTDAGEVISAGLPRAAGIDLSNRMSLGTLYFIDLKTDTAESTVGSLAGAFGGPLVNLAMGWWKGAQYMQQGQVSKGLESFLPKAAKDIAKTIRYSSEGLTDATGKEIIGADKMSPWQLFAQSIGFQPSQVSEAYGRRAAIKDAQTYDADRRKTLMMRFQNARTPEARADVLGDITVFNKTNPAASISRSQLMKSIVSFKERAARTSRFGVDLRGKNALYANEGDYYEEAE